MFFVATAFSSISSDEPVSAQGEAGLPEAGLPAAARADGGRVAQEALLLFLAGQEGEAVVQEVLRVEEGFLAVQDGRVGAVGVVEAGQLPGAQGQPHAAQQGGVGFGVEVGVGEVGEPLIGAEEFLFLVPRQINRVRSERHVFGQSKPLPVKR